MYSVIFSLIFLEMIIPGMPLKKILGIPACYIYNWIITLWVLNIILSLLIPKNSEKALQKFVMDLKPETV